MHLARMHRMVCEFEPDVVIIDPISNLLDIGTVTDVRSTLTRIVDFFKGRQLTALMTSLTHATPRNEEASDAQISSLVDTWILVRVIESDGERNRGLYVLKLRGTSHSNQVREVRLTDHGINLVDVYLGTEGVLVGSARESRLIRETAAAREREHEAQKQERRMDHRRATVRAQIDALNAELEADEEEQRRAVERDQFALRGLGRDEVRMASARNVVQRFGGNDRWKAVQP